MADERAVFYYDTNSPYAYLAAERVRDVIPGAVWRPIAFGVVLREVGRTPWSLKPGREEGMADCEKRAAERGLPPVTWPEGWPAETWSFAPLRAQIVAEEHDVLVPFALELYRKMFVESRSHADTDSIASAASAVGLDPDEVSERIGEPAVKERLRAYTDEALALGVIGVPTVAAGGELFWGDDRLEDAAVAAGVAS